MNKPNINYCYKLLQDGYSLITVGANKRPNYTWKRYQTEQISKEQFTKQYQYNGGYFYHSKRENKEVELPATTGVGIVTGFDNLEVLDIDLKIFKTLKQQQDFWNELLQFWKDNIDDFDNKFTIYKTVSGGYHVLYKCEKIQGNTKIAKLKDYKEAVIESRGIGGYVFIYDRQISKNSYSEVKEISIQDREVLWTIAEAYNHIEEKPEVGKQDKEYIELKTTVWDDFNNQNNILDIIKDELEVVKNLQNFYLVKRYGAKSPHSGYVYKDSGCMYLFSTGTIYPAEKIISPFSAYAYKYFDGDFSQCAKELYKKGFGERIVREINTIDIDVKKEDLTFPIEILPKEFQNYILECKRTLSLDVDFMGCSLLWLFSVLIGNSIQIEVKKGWIEKCNLWFAMVGKAGIGKTPSIKIILKPLLKLNNREIERYNKEVDKYDYYRSLSKEEKKNTEEIHKPIKTQFIANDITIEALVDLHEQNKNAVGVFKDELAGWFKDMNKYRAGSDLEFWLSTWSGDPANFNRLTRKGSFVQNPFIPVLGGIQPNILNQFYTEENKDNGFIDRVLLCYPDQEIEMYNENEIDQELLDWYDDIVLSIRNAIMSNIKLDHDNEIKPSYLKWSSEAKKEWIRIFNEITMVQNADYENEYIKSMYPKQKSYIPRFAMILNVINEQGIEITKESILGAEKLSQYFIQMAKKIKVDSYTTNEVKKSIHNAKNKTKKEQCIEAYLKNPDIKKVTLAELFGVSRVTINNWLKSIDNATKKR